MHASPNAIDVVTLLLHATSNLVGERAGHVSKHPYCKYCSVLMLTSGNGFASVGFLLLP